MRMDVFVLEHATRISDNLMHYDGIGTNGSTQAIHVLPVTIQSLLLLQRHSIIELNAFEQLLLMMESIELE